MNNRSVRHYSGDKSRKFWDRINSLPEPHRVIAYTLGVVLQNVETDILRLIDIEIAQSREIAS